MKPVPYSTKKVLFYITFTICMLVGLSRLDVIFGVVNYIFKLFMPFLLGGCIAFILNIPMKFFEHIGEKLIKNKRLQIIIRPISIILSALLIGTIIFIVCVVILPEFVNTIVTLFNSLSTFAIRVQSDINKLSETYPQLSHYLGTLEIDWTNIDDHIISFMRELANRLFSSTINIVGSILSTVMTFVIAFVFSLYLLYRKEVFAGQMKQLLYAFLPMNRADRICTIFSMANRIFAGFISGQCTEAIIQGVMFYVALRIFNFPYALLISIFIAFMSLIPIFGSYISSWCSAFLIFMISPIKALAFLIMFAILQQLEDTFIYPHVVGSSVGLPSIWVLVAVTIGGSLMGIVGMLLCIPVCSLCYAILREHVKKRLELRAIPKEKLI